MEGFSWFQRGFRPMLGPCWATKIPNAKRKVLGIYVWLELMTFTSMSATTALLGTNFLFPTLNLTSRIDKKRPRRRFQKTHVFFWKFTRVCICHHLGFFGAILGHVGTTFMGCEVPCWASVGCVVFLLFCLLSFNSFSHRFLLRNFQYNIWTAHFQQNIEYNIWTAEGGGGSFQP